MNIKIALIDNMNNNFFAFARYLRDLGIEAHLYEIHNSELDHFKPQADTFMDVSKLNWIHNFPVNVNNKSWLLFDKKRIIDEFKKYDLLISCGLSSAFSKRAGFNSDIIIPYGADLYDIPFRSIRFSFSLDFARSIFWNSQAKWQKRAYKDARVITIDAITKLYSVPLKKLNIAHINQSLPMFYNLEDYSNILLYNVLDKKKLSVLEESDFVVFNHSRQYWATNLNNLDDFDKYLGLKRNDKVIRAFANFIKYTKFRKPMLVLFEYGPDVKKSKELIAKLGIDKNVIWFSKLERKFIFFLLKKYAHIGTDQFRENISDGFSGTSYEILAAGKPLVKYFATFDKYKHTPAINALTEQDILNIFIDYEKNPQKYKEIGKKAKEWFDENLGMGLAKKYVKLIELLVKDKTLTQNDKVIREIFEK